MIERLLVIGGFLAYCLILSLWGIERDRPAWRVLAAFASIDICVELAFWDAGADWGPLIYAFREFLVIKALQQWAWNPFGKRIACVVGLFFTVHLFLYLDLELGTNMVYDHYEIAIRALLAALVALGTHGFTGMAKGCLDRLRKTGGVRGYGFQLDFRRVRCQKDVRED